MIDKIRHTCPVCGSKQWFNVASDTSLKDSHKECLSCGYAAEMQSGKMPEITLRADPFSWNDNMAEIAIEDFEMYRSDMSYCAAQSIGTALAKLKIMEEQGLKVEE